MAEAPITRPKIKYQGGKVALEDCEVTAKQMRTLTNADVGDLVGKDLQALSHGVSCPFSTGILLTLAGKAIPSRPVPFEWLRHQDPGRKRWSIAKIPEGP